MSDRFRKVSTEEVEQLVHAGERVRLRKDVLEFDGRVGLVRKHPLRWRQKPVILVHGFAQNRYTWHTSRRSLSASLAHHGFDTWNVELPGHGRSRGSSSPERFETYVDTLADVIRAVTEETGQRPFLVGHSLGGAVAYAASTQAEVRGIVGIGALYHFARANPTLLALVRLSHAMAELPAQVSALGASGLRDFGDRTPSPGAAFVKGILGGINVRTHLAGRVLGRLYALSDVAGYALPVSGWAPGSMEPELLAERLEKGFDWTSTAVWFEMARWGATARFAYEDAWAQSRTPLLVMAGDLDHLALPDDARIAYDRTGATDRTFEVYDVLTTGEHWGHLDLVLGRHAPDHTWPALRAWMASR